MVDFSFFSFPLEMVEEYIVYNFNPISCLLSWIVNAVDKLNPAKKTKPYPTQENQTVS